MRIGSVANVNQVYTSNYEVTNNKKAIMKDQVSFSQTARELQIAKQAVKDVDDVREDKVAEMKKKMAGGYDVTADQLADKLWGDYSQFVL